MKDVQSELGRIVENIADERTSEEKKRKLIIELSIEVVGEGRQEVHMDYEVKSKLASIQGVGGHGYISKTPAGKAALFMQTSLLDNISTFER